MKIKLLLATGALLAGTSAWAQSTPAEQTSEDLVCQLSGDCEGVAAIEPTEDMPDSRGFKIARKTASNDAAAPAASAIQRARARVIPESSRPSVAATAPGKARPKAAAPARAKPAAIGRADMMVTFVSGSAQLTPSGQRSATAFLKALSAPQLAGKKFRIEGHTDSAGSRELNLELSRQRAQSVVDYLVGQGADPSRFEVVGYGFDKPLDGKNAAAGVNRRVEVVLVK